MGTPPGYALSCEVSSLSKEASASELSNTIGSNMTTSSSFGSHGSTHPAMPARIALFDASYISKSTLAPQHDVPPPVSYNPNRWCVDG